MDSYSESSNKAKLVREGIVEARPVSKGQKGKTKDWLIISISSRNISRDFRYINSKYVGTLEITGEYASEDIAIRALPDLHDRYEDTRSHYLFGRYYVITRDAYENVYRPLWKRLLEADINSLKQT